MAKEVTITLPTDVFDKLVEALPPFCRFMDGGDSEEEHLLLWTPGCKIIVIQEES